jgi:hypothetical protein
VRAGLRKKCGVDDEQMREVLARIVEEPLQRRPQRAVQEEVSMETICNVADGGRARVYDCSASPTAPRRDYRAG